MVDERPPASGHPTVVSDPTLSFADVPDAEDDARLDPNWTRLRGPSTLPAAYLPPAMGGQHAAWVRFAALFLVAVFLLATVAGVCLTYGPGY